MLHDAAFFLEVFVMSKRSVRFLSVVLSSLLLGSNVCTFAGVGSMKRSVKGGANRVNSYTVNRASDFKFKGIRKSKGQSQSAFGWGCLFGLGGGIFAEEVIRYLASGENSKEDKVVDKTIPYSPADVVDSGLKFVGSYSEAYYGVVRKNDKARLEKLKEACEKELVSRKVKVEEKDLRELSKVYPPNSVEISNFYDFGGVLGFDLVLEAKNLEVEEFCKVINFSGGSRLKIHFSLALVRDWCGSPEFKFTPDKCYLSGRRYDTPIVGKLCGHVGVHDQTGDLDMQFAYAVSEYIASNRRGETGKVFGGGLSDRCRKEICYLTPLIFEKMCNLRVGKESK